MKILITGYKGFIGSNLLRQLSGDIIKIEKSFLNNDNWKDLLYSYVE